MWMSLLEVIRKTQAQTGLQRNPNDALEWLRLIREGGHFGSLAGVALSNQEIGGEGHTTFKKI